MPKNRKSTCQNNRKHKTDIIDTIDSAYQLLCHPVLCEVKLPPRRWLTGLASPTTHSLKKQVLRLLPTHLDRRRASNPCCASPSGRCGKSHRSRLGCCVALASISYVSQLSKTSHAFHSNQNQKKRMGGLGLTRRY